jgi:hypothetical protein
MITSKETRKDMLIRRLVWSQRPKLKKQTPSQLTTTVTIPSLRKVLQAISRKEGRGTG